MSWNYRVVRRWLKDSGEYQLGVHEAYYDKNGRVRAISEEPEPMVVFGKEAKIEQLQEMRMMMFKAIQQPILDYDKVPDPEAVSFEQEAGIKEPKP